MSILTARFGPAGSDDSFAAMGYKKNIQIPEFLEKMGLNAFEYQCGRGVRINEEAMTKLGQLAAEKDIAMSLHAPYYISLSSVEEEKRRNSSNYILQSAQAVKLLGGDRIVVHSGSCSKISREEALVLAKEAMGWALAELDNAGLGNIRVCPETMGKINQLGTLEEVLELCTLDERMLPCIDFGHLNARTFGEIKGMEDYVAIFDAVENKLGHSRLMEFHAHFSKIEYTQNGGEKRHLTFEDTVFGPDFEPLAELIAKRGCHPTIICESAGTQAIDAAAMRRSYQAVLEKGE
ncbi:MAG: TIM barrel protein [Oscillospiraceae bacterium]|nr:TIM barrel protein [Oscillospiraceae bacterium]